ncbi:MAG TPA: response regulator [Minicystis sp.]|nr:response regulator [Minicystis sp.]
MSDKRARILAIDDEPMLVAVYARMLRRYHDVVPVVGGSAAIELLERDAAFDVVLCDVMMPEVSGLDVYRTAARLSRELAARFVFLTGGAHTDEAARFLATERVPTLDKPAELQALLAAIAARLDGGSG